MKASDFTPKTKEKYDDEDLVYVDTQARAVVGLVEWDKNGEVKPLLQKERVREAGAPVEQGQKEKDGKEKEKGKGRKRTRTYVWGTYRTVKKLYKVEGKILEQKPMIALDDAIEKSMKEPYWD